MNRNKHLLLWSSVGVLALLVIAAGDENFFKEWRRLQGRVARASPTGEFEVKLRQIVVPRIGVTDRCVSCHVGMAAGEPGIPGDSVLGAHKKLPHDPAEFGCTVCHGGQGRATEKLDAHGAAEFWPQPMIPRKYAQAGCGSCHTHLGVTNLSILRRGAQLVDQLDCLACHALDGRGGVLRPGGAAGVAGPDLSLAGANGYRKEWYEQHLAKHDAAAGGAWKTSFGPIAGDDREAIAVLLGSRAGVPKLVEAKALFHSAGCRGCHKIGGVGGDDGPDLTLEGQKDPGLLAFSNVEGEHTVEAWFKAHFRNPAALVPGSMMPALGLSDEEIDLLTLYLFSLRRSELPEAYWPKDRIQATRFGVSEFARDGATLYGTFCAACHGRSGQGMRYAGMSAFPAIASRGFLSLASDDFMMATISKGRPGRRMPAWERAEGGLTREEMGRVVAYVRAMGGGVKPAAPDDRTFRAAGDPARGAVLFARNCALCHGKNGQGGEGPALNNRVLLAAATDRYLVETVRGGRPGTLMPTFGMPSTTRPSLSADEIESVVSYIRTWGVK
jgi:cbb3-type cytochrome c oxidase subunit III